MRPSKQSNREESVMAWKDEAGAQKPCPGDPEDVIRGGTPPVAAVLRLDVLCSDHPTLFR